MKKANTIEGTNYNPNELSSDRKFEELIHRIFEYRIKDELKEYFDNAYLMSGVAERGIDILLKKNKKNEGVVQCKMNTSGPLSKPIAIKEIIKFILYYILDESLIDNIKNFKYYLVCSGKYSNPAILILSDFNDKILEEKDIEKWTNEVISKYISFSEIKYNNIKEKLFKILKNINIIPENNQNINESLVNNSRIVDEFFSIKKVIEDSSITNDLSEIKEKISPDLEKKAKTLIQDYYKSAKVHLNSVKFIGFDVSFNRPRNITVSKLFVEPDLSIRIKRDNKSSRNVRSNEINTKIMNIANALKRSKNLVLLGDPGAGKSLLVKSIILRIIKKNKVGGFKALSTYIPFRIELRKYSEHKIKYNTNISSYLYDLLKTEYQIFSYEVEVIEYLLSCMKVFIIFDGLDEIFDIAQKNCIRDDIVNFSNINQNIKCLITSRPVGYDDNSFPEEKFEELFINGFSDIKIDNFIEKFYAIQVTNKTERDAEINNFKRQINEIDYSLKSNPLILSLMSLLALNRIVIPDSKLDVYRSCTNTLVETRDRTEKQLNFKLQIKSIRGTFGSLAYWQYVQMTNKSKISRILAKKSVSSYLYTNKEYESVIESEEVAEEFLKFAESRSIYFDNNFMHKTFLEYYTADYIFTKYHNGFKHDVRDKIIHDNISNTAWHIIFELLISMIDEQLVEADTLDELFNKILVKSKNINNYVFFLKVLKNTKNISKSVKKEIIKNSLEHLLNIQDSGENSIVISERSNELLNVLQQYSNITSYRNFFNIILNNIESKMKTNDEKNNFFIFIYEFMEYIGKEKSEDDYNYKISDDPKEFYKANISSFTIYNYRFINLKELSIYTIIEQKNIFGFESLFIDHQFKYRSDLNWKSIFQVYLDDIKIDSFQELTDQLLLLSENGISLNTIKECIKKNIQYKYIGTRFFNKINDLPSLSIDQIDIISLSFIEYLYSIQIKRTKSELNNSLVAEISSYVNNE